jgi:hypothetical protein
LTLRRALALFFYVVFVTALCWICFVRPVSGDFDRYIYEALVRGRYQDVQRVYPVVKHENPRAEASSVLDSPEHLGQLEPLYAIRPLYLKMIEAVARRGVPIQRAINLVSVLSLFGIGLVLLGWTRRPFYCALVLATPAISGLGRIGTPDALSSLLLLLSTWVLVRGRVFPGVLLLLVSVWSRTDNILFVILILVWLAGTGKLSVSHAALLSLVGVASVLVINHFSGNYGWSVLLRYSFIGGRSPAEIAAHVSLRDYIIVLGRGVEGIGGQETTLWTLLGLAAWRWLPKGLPSRQVLVPVALAAMARFLLFPTAEDRYFAWAYVIVGACFIEAIGNSAYFPRISSASQSSR